MFPSHVLRVVSRHVVCRTGRLCVGRPYPWDGAVQHCIMVVAHGCACASYPRIAPNSMHAAPSASRLEMAAPVASSAFPHAFAHNVSLARTWGLACRGAPGGLVWEVVGSMHRAVWGIAAGCGRHLLPLLPRGTGAGCPPCVVWHTACTGTCGRLKLARGRGSITRAASRGPWYPPWAVRRGTPRCILGRFRAPSAPGY